MFSSAMLWLLFSVCLISKASLAYYVTDLDPNIDCPGLLAQKVDERENDPTLVSN